MYRYLLLLPVIFILASTIPTPAHAWTTPPIRLNDKTTEPQQYNEGKMYGPENLKVEHNPQIQEMWNTRLDNHHTSATATPDFQIYKPLSTKIADGIGSFFVSIRDGIVTASSWSFGKVKVGALATGRFFSHLYHNTYPFLQKHIHIFSILPESWQISMGNWVNNHPMVSWMTEHPLVSGAAIGIAGGLLLEVLISSGLLAAAWTALQRVGIWILSQINSGNFISSVIGGMVNTLEYAVDCYFDPKESLSLGGASMAFGEGFAVGRINLASRGLNTILITGIAAYHDFHAGKPLEEILIHSAVVAGVTYFGSKKIDKYIQNPRGRDIIRWTKRVFNSSHIKARAMKDTVQGMVNVTGIAIKHGTLKSIEFIKSLFKKG